MRRALAAGLLAALALAAPAKAQVTCGSILPIDLFPMTLTATALSFGDYRATDAAPAEASGTITATCPALLNLLPAFTISLSTGASGTYAARTMTSGSDTLDYNLYTAPDYVSVWGDGTGGTSTVSFNQPLTLGETTFTIYGRAPAGQWSAAGTYQDTIVVTVAF